MSSDIKVLNYRKKFQQSKSGFYHGYLHYLINVLFATFFLVLFLMQIETFNTLVLSAIPVALIIFSFVEYCSHRIFFHHRRKPFEFTYDEHAGGHHLYFADNTNEIHEHFDFRRVIFPWYGIFLYILVGLPINISVGLLVSRDYGLMFMSCQILYFIIYEHIHLACHLPSENKLVKIKWIQKVRKHHHDHHRSELMKDYNFGISSPLFDYIFSTKLKNKTE